MGRKQDLEDENERLRADLKAFERAAGCRASELDSDDDDVCLAEARRVQRQFEERIDALEIKVENLKEEVKQTEKCLRKKTARKAFYKEELASLRDAMEGREERLREKRDRYKRQRLLRRDTEAIAQLCNHGGAPPPKLWYPDDPTNGALLRKIAKQ